MPRDRNSLLPAAFSRCVAGELRKKRGGRRVVTMPGVAAHGGRSLSARARLRDEARGSACELGRRLPDVPSPNDAPSGSIWSVAFALRIPVAKNAMTMQLMRI